MRGALTVVCMLLCGCDTVFQLDREEVPDPPSIPVATVIIDPNGDFDGDGQPNATDLCPMIEDDVIGADEDTDGDGVGNLCDPAPTVPGDCLALFDVFQDASPLSPRWRSTGATITKSPGRMIIPPGAETVVYLDVDLALTSLTVAGYIDGGSGGQRAIQLLFDHDRINGVTGRACSVEDDEQVPAMPTIAVVDVVGGIDTKVVSISQTGPAIGPGTTVEVGWNDRHSETGAMFIGRCRADLADNSTPPLKANTGVGAVPPEGGAFGLRTLTVGFHVDRIIGYGRNCAP